MKKHWTSFGSGYIEFELPVNAVTDCSHSGECYADCLYWQRQLNLNLDKGNMVKELEVYGAWTLDELKEMSNVELEIKCIWIASGDISDNL